MPYRSRENESCCRDRTSSLYLLVLTNVSEGLELSHSGAPRARIKVFFGDSFADDPLIFRTWARAIHDADSAAVPNSLRINYTSFRRLLRHVPRRHEYCTLRTRLISKGGSEAPINIINGSIATIADTKRRKPNSERSDLMATLMRMTLSHSSSSICLNGFGRNAEKSEASETDTSAQCHRIVERRRRSSHRHFGSDFPTCSMTRRMPTDLENNRIRAVHHRNRLAFASAESPARSGTPVPNRW